MTLNIWPKFTSPYLAGNIPVPTLLGPQISPQHRLRPPTALL